MTLNSKLLELYSKDGEERGGFIVNEIIECKNVSPTPKISFKFSDEDLERINHPNVTATFHIHPGGTFNLSVEDYKFFEKHPRLKHYIVGKEGLACYTADEEKIVYIWEYIFR